MNTNKLLLLLLLAALMVTVPDSLRGQTFPSRDIKVFSDSGDHFNHGQKPSVVWTDTIEAKGATWIRLNFQRIVLADDPDGNTCSTLRIVSLQDGAEQFLNPRSARQWQNTTAYFNGSGVRLELIAWPNGRLNRVIVDSGEAGEVPLMSFPETICDVLDDRTLSSDVRVGRTIPGGCTAWLFNDRRNCLLTAGHCASSTSVIEFNTPLSNPDGSYNHPSPDHQYPVDPTSMQFVDGGIGNDWCYFGCFENSNTGLSAFEAQGSSFQLELPQPVGAGDMIRITGHGTTSAPVDPTWNGAQKTQLGPHLIFTASELGYRTDTTGGNSGSPVIYENDGTAIGIHTHGGCSSGGEGSNAGTGANNLGLQTALANPLGVCRDSLGFEFPNGRPPVLNPAGGTTMRVEVVTQGAIPEPGTGMLHFDSGGGFQSIPMTPVSPNVYDAVFPALPCGFVIDYYVSAESDLSEQFSEPVDAPASSFSAISAEQLQTVFLDDFETNMAWSVSGDATDGQWDRGVPVGGGDRGDPPADADGSGSCYLTDNVDDNSDVDGGSTVLTSPVMDGSVSQNEQAIVSFYRWYSNTAGSAPQADIFLVEISNDGGSNWTNLETVGPAGSQVAGGWIKKSFRISEFVVPTSQMRLRFTASDLADGSVVEAGVDGVEIQVVNCLTPVLAEGSKLLDGLIAGGQLSETFISDDVYLELDPSPTANPIKQKIDLILLSTSVNALPMELRFKLEARMLGGPSGDVLQSIRLLNFQTGLFELVDSRAAANSDEIVDIGVAGDPSRFVQPVTREITAQLTWQSASFSGTPFFWNVDVDQAIWLVDMPGPSSFMGSPGGGSKSQGGKRGTSGGKGSRGSR